jgi:Bacterial regulatory protein, arsR family
MSVLRVADARRRAVKVRPSSRTVLADARDAADLLKALAHEARLVILCLLVEGEKTVTELGELIGRRQAAISQQLRGCEPRISSKPDARVKTFTIRSPGRRSTKSSRRRIGPSATIKSAQQLVAVGSPDRPAAGRRPCRCLPVLDGHGS